MMRNSLRTLGAVTVLALPVLLLLVAALLLPDEPASLQQRFVPEATRITKISASDERAVRMTIALPPLTPVYSPGWSSVIGTVAVENGRTLRSGDVVARVGGFDRIALATDTPFTRSLSSGSRGDDVSMLQDFLRDIGLLEGESDGVFGSATANAVLEFERTLGDPEADRSFDPTTFLWLPRTSIDVESVAIRPGATGPAAGGVVLEYSDGVPNISIEVAATGERLNNIPDGFILIAEDAPGLSWTTLDQAPSESSPDAYASFLDKLRAEGPDSNGEAEGSEGDGGEAPSVLDGRIQRATPIDLLSLPSSAVVTDPSSGKTCYFEYEAPEHRAVEVEVVGGQLGTVFIESPDAKVGQTVVRNPLDLEVLSSCD